MSVEAIGKTPDGRSDTTDPSPKPMKSPAIRHWHPLGVGHASAASFIHPPKKIFTHTFSIIYLGCALTHAFYMMWTTDPSPKTHEASPLHHWHTLELSGAKTPGRIVWHYVHFYRRGWEKMREFICHCGARAVPVRLLSGADGKLPWTAQGGISTEWLERSFSTPWAV
jgi:hypothetical protein